MPKRKVPLGTMLHYTRVLKRADYALFNVANRKDWEVQLALKTLNDGVTITQVVNGQVPLEYVLREEEFVFTSVHIAMRKL